MKFEQELHNEGQTPEYVMGYLAGAADQREHDAKLCDQLAAEANNRVFGEAQADAYALAADTIREQDGGEHMTMRKGRDVRGT